MPEEINYLAVVRNISGEVFENPNILTQITVKARIIGAEIYVRQHDILTSEYRLTKVKL